MTDTFLYPNCNNHTNSKPEDACKIFVGGLSWDTNQENLNNYFKKFGEVVDCILMMDTATKRSRGFGFVTYKDSNAVMKVLEGGPHILDNKSIDPKAAVPRFTAASTPKPSTHSSSPVLVRRCNKIFVGGIGQATEDDLRSHFQTYGNVTDVTIMMDKNTGRPRGFAFVGFESVESSEHTAQIRYHTIKGKRVEVKVAQPRDAKCLDGNGLDLTVTLDDGDICYDLPLEQSSDYQPDVVTKNIRINNSISQFTKNSIVQLLNDIWK